MNILLQIISGVAGLTLLYYGAEFMVSGGVALARRLHISPLVIGLTLVAGATSAPEMVVSILSALKGAGDISLGNVVGSNICNIALILGVSALLAPVKVNMNLFRLDVPLLLLSSAALWIFFTVSGGINRIEAAAFLLTMILYMTWNVYDAKKHPEAAGDAEKEEKLLPLWRALLYVAGGIAGLVIGAKFLVDAAIFFARLWGMSQAVIALTIVAVGTSLPELATSVVAALRKEGDIAIGNVVGSNIFNILSILGVAPLICPVKAQDVGHTDMLIMCVLTLLLVPIMLTGKKISHIEGAFLLLIYAGYTAFLLLR